MAWILTGCQPWHRQAERADAYARVWKLLEVVQHLVLEVCITHCVRTTTGSGGYNATKLLRNMCRELAACTALHRGVRRPSAICIIRFRSSQLASPCPGVAAVATLLVWRAGTLHHY